MRKVSDNKKTKREAGRLAKAVAGTTAGMMTMAAVLAAVPVNAAADEVIMEWREENGVKYWYENGVRQGVKYNADGSIDISYRGKEIYDPSSAAWYWLDCVQNGAVAKNKDVYQESAAGQWGAGTNENGEKVGKWVRYDENGHMVKGWQTTDAGTYYFDPVYGTMAKGDVVIDGQSYYFNKDTGILERSGQTDDDGNSFLTDGWHKVGGVNYWYENGVRQGVKYNADGSIDISYRGKEIYDPSSAAWYWLDCVQNGAVAKNKDVYQESAAGQWGAGTNENGEKVGKWVRYDENGHMVKGWQNTEAGTYYFDTVYGTMAKGTVDIEGKKYEFDSVSGKLVREINEDTKTELSACTVTLSQTSYEYDGNEKKPQITVKNGNDIIASTEYTVSYSDNVNAGTATVTVTANGNSAVVTGSVSKAFVITKKQEAENKIEWNISDDGKLTVTGSCDGVFYTDKNRLTVYPWNEYKDQIRSAYINVKGVTDLSYLFDGCSNLETVDLSDLDTSQVKYMRRMFRDCSSLTSLDLSGFDTRNVRDMYAMFYNCDSLSNVDIRSFDTSSVYDMSFMFGLCRSLKILNLSNFDTSNVTNMEFMFVKCYGLTGINVSSFDTSRVTDMGAMFYDCSSLKYLDVSNFDTSNVTDMGGMFNGCRSLTNINLKNFNTSKVETMPAMFYNCSSIDHLDVSSFDTRNVTNMHAMFYNCSSLTGLDLNSFDTGSVTDMSDMFAGCNELLSLDLSNFDTSNVTDMSNMFGKEVYVGCSKLSSIDLSSFDTGNVTDMSDMFNGCSGLSSIDLSSFDTGKVTDMKRMFNGCSGLNSIGLGNFDTSNVEYMGYMFNGCSSLTSLDLRSFDTSSVENMSGMFGKCENLKEITVGSAWNTSNAKYTYGMFDGCGTGNVTVR